MDPTATVILLVVLLAVLQMVAQIGSF